MNGTRGNKMTTKAEMMERFMKLEKVDVSDFNGYLTPTSLEKITTPLDFVIPRKFTDFYSICKHMDTFGVEYKVYRKKEYYVVEVTK